MATQVSSISVPARFPDDHDSGAPGYSSLLRQVGDVGVLEHLEQGGLGVGPDTVGGTPSLAGAGMIAGQAEVQPDWPLDGFHHLQHRGCAVPLVQFEPAGALRFHGHTSWQMSQPNTQSPMAARSSMSMELRSSIVR